MTYAKRIFFATISAKIDTKRIKWNCSPAELYGALRIMWAFISQPQASDLPHGTWGRIHRSGIPLPEWEKVKAVMIAQYAYFANTVDKCFYLHGKI